MNSDAPIHVLNKRLALRQIAGGFRTSIDAVLLAASCPVKAGQHVLDMGCGIGTAGLCVLARVNDAQLSGIDIQGDHVEVARENAALNKMEARFIAADIKTYIDIESGKNRLFDHIICNPPYNDEAHYSDAATKSKSTAMALHGGASLKDWVDCANRNLKARGSLSIVHKAEKLDDILHSFDQRFGAVEVFPFWPKAGKAAGRVIVRGIKDKKGGLILHPGIVLHEDDGRYTSAADEILRDMKPL